MAVGSSFDTLCSFVAELLRTRRWLKDDVFLAELLRTRRWLKDDVFLAELLRTQRWLKDDVFLAELLRTQRWLKDDAFVADLLRTQRGAPSFRRTPPCSSWDQENNTMLFSSHLLTLTYFVEPLVCFWASITVAQMELRQPLRPVRAVSHSVIHLRPSALVHAPV